MISRAGMSTQLQNSEDELSASKGMSVALIGPNDAHRKIVAAALGSSQGRQVHEFIDYPDKLSDLPRMLDQNFDVVLVDVDTDQSYAIQIIAKVSELGLAAMAYSARNDQDLLMSCMRAGARDFLPLPANEPERSQAPSPAPRPSAPAQQAVPPRPSAPAQQTVPKQPEPRPAAPPVAPPPAPRSNVTPIVPEKRVETVHRFSEERAALDAQMTQTAPPPIPDPVAAPPEEPAIPEVVSEFAEWDAAHLRRATAPPAQKPAPPTQKAESRPRPSLVPERKKDEAPERAVTSVVPAVVAAPPAVERPPVADIFRSAQLDYSDRDSTATRKQGAGWLKWVFIAAGPLVLALVLLIVFTHPSVQNSSGDAAKHSPAPAAEQASAPQPEGELIVNATGKPSAGTPLVTTAKTSGAAGTTPTTEIASPSEPKPVSPDAMAAQLVAPTRIAGSVKQTSQSNGPPPSAPVPAALDEGSTLPGAVFGGSSKVKYAPHVVAISAGVADGMIIRKTQPIYPKFAQDAHITGKVVLKATITKQGLIEGVQVISGPKILAPSAVDAVKTWKYRPYLLDNQPVDVETNITVVFGAAAK